MPQSAQKLEQLEAEEEGREASGEYDGAPQDSDERKQIKNTVLKCACEL